MRRLVAIKNRIKLNKKVGILRNTDLCPDNYYRKKKTRKNHNMNIKEKELFDAEVIS